MTQTPQAPFQQWLETAQQFDHHAPQNVTCPCCGSSSLSVKDVEYGFGHEKGVQRYITCGCCGAFTGVNIKRAGEDRATATAGETLLAVHSGRA
jgi:formate dehydrogenase maturation protein FdhE